MEAGSRLVQASVALVIARDPVEVIAYKRALFITHLQPDEDERILLS